MKTTILIADDHAIVRSGLVQVIIDEADMFVAAQVATGEEAIACIRARAFDVVILDIGMPDKNGIDTLRAIKQTRPTQKVLILSGYPEAQYAVNLLRAGANGYISKEKPASEILRAIRIVSRGHCYLSESAADMLALKLNEPTSASIHEALSKREFQVFYKLAAGLLPSEIADQLCLSVKTVSTYRARVLEKMQMSSNADLTYYAIKNNLIN